MELFITQVPMGVIPPYIIDSLVARGGAGQGVRGPEPPASIRTTHEIRANPGTSSGGSTCCQAGQCSRSKRTISSVSNVAQRQTATG